MNPIRLRYFLLCLLSLAITLGLAYGLAEVGDPLFAELGVLVGVTVVLAYFIGRNSEREDESSGIISFDDDD